MVGGLDLERDFPGEGSSDYYLEIRQQIHAI